MRGSTSSLSGHPDGRSRRDPQDAAPSVRGRRRALGRAAPRNPPRVEDRLAQPARRQPGGLRHERERLESDTAATGFGAAAQGVTDWHERCRQPPLRGEGVALSPAQTTLMASLQEFRLSMRSSLAQEVVPEDAARRRGASRVTANVSGMCPLVQPADNNKVRFAGTLPKPSNGLEPSTPSLPFDTHSNRSQPTATDSASFCESGGRAICR